MKSFYQKQYPSKNIKSHKVSSKFLEKLVNDAIISDIPRQSEISRCNSSLQKGKTLWIRQIIDQ